MGQYTKLDRCDGCSKISTKSGSAWSSSDLDMEPPRHKRMALGGALSVQKAALDTALSFCMRK
jgi:hypothetical protein